MFVNSYMKKVDMDELIKKNVEKMNKKRAKKGLPPAKINQNAAASLKNIQAKQEAEEAELNRRLERNAKQIKDPPSSTTQIRSLAALRPRPEWFRSTTKSTTNRRGAVWI